MRKENEILESFSTRFLREHQNKGGITMGLAEKLQGLVPEMDMNTAKNYCGNDDMILQIAVSSYCEQDFTGDLQKYFDAKDVPNYQIIIHGIKSTSLTIGLTDLSEKAKALEMACKENNVAYIEENHAPVLALYTDILGRLKSAL